MTELEMALSTLEEYRKQVGSLQDAKELRRKHRVELKTRLKAETDVATLRELVRELSRILQCENPLADILRPSVQQLLTRCDSALATITITGEK